MAGALILALGIAGLGVDEKLRPTSLSIPGTESARAEALLQRHFGDSSPFAVLLRGPAAAIDRQGPALVAALRADRRVSTLSPWDGDAVARLRPGPGRALILVDFRVGIEEAVDDVVPALERTLQERVRPPLQANQTGFATLSRAIQEESVSSTRRAELIAVPVLLVVLLIVFGSPVAAAIPLALGALTVLASRGVLALLAPHVAIDGFALTVCTMMGLALGVDYALLIVSRFREELAAGAAPPNAAEMTQRVAGTTAAFAGSTLLIAMAVTLLLMPGTLLVSLAGAAIVVTAISVAIAVLVAPPLLLLLGPNVDRWRLRSKKDDGGRLMAAVRASLRRPRLAAAAIGAVLLALAAPALAVKTGPPSAAQLPASDEARVEAERIDRESGPGWDAPFAVLAATERGTIADPRRFAAVSRLQRRIAADPGVEAVIGPAQVSRRVAPLRRNAERLLAGRGDASPARLRRLGRGIDRAAGGIGRLRDGLAAASAGAGLLATGSDRAGEGAERIRAALRRAGEGAGEAGAAIRRLDEGSGRLADAQHRAALAALSLRFELAELLSLIRRDGVTRARRLREELHRGAAADPSLAAQAREADRLVEALAVAEGEVGRLGGIAGDLRRGQERIAGGTARLHRGAAELAERTAPLAEGLARLGGGAARLAEGLARLGGGAGALQGSLASGYAASRPLQGGLSRAGRRVDASASRFSAQIGELRRSAPHIFDSGHFVLSALAGAPREERLRAGRVVDFERGGQAARLVVVPRFSLDTPGSSALYRRLREEVAGLRDASSLQAAVGGGPAELDDYETTVADRIPFVIAAISVVTFLALVLILRAIPLAAIAVLLNLLTVAVAFGVLTLLFDVPQGWPLGGHDYVDAIGAAGIFGIVFGLSIDYAVFLLVRMREAREGGASNEEAIAVGLRRTARVISGAAAIMAAVFACFAAAPIATVSQLGVGLTVAVLLDATVVRIVLLPALMLAIGERVWWLPGPLERLLPKVTPHPA
jgi:RND superfamily putative drug exporter